MKSFSIQNYVILFIVLIIAGTLYKWLEEKRIIEENKENYNSIQKYLLDDVTLAKSKKPILWIHVPREYNSRKWLSFGSRSSYELNQPYLYLTTKSIIKNCDNSFTICFIDDESFCKLIPGWSINMNTISSPVSDNMRKLGLMKLIHRYGGLNCPISFLCMKDLIGLYNKGTQGNKMFLCENVDRNITSTCFNVYPDLCFFGAPKENESVMQFIDFMQRTISTDFTAESVFLGDFDRYADKKVKNGEINLISGLDIGTKTIDERAVIVDDLMSQNYLNIGTQVYGILIPARDIINRKKFEWFARLSQKQVLESNTIIGNYILLATAPNKNGEPSILEPLQVEPDNWVGFWKTPLYPGLYGQKPNFLGDNLQMLEYSGR